MSDPSGFDPGEGPSGVNLFRRPLILPNRQPRSWSRSPPRPRILKRRSPPRDPAGSFTPFPFRSGDVTGYPYTPDYHKAASEGTLPFSEAASLLPEPHATALRESHPGVINHPSFQSPSPFEWQLGEDIDTWSSDDSDGGRFLQRRRPNLDGLHSNHIADVLDRGVLNESSNFVPTRLPGYKGVRKWGQFSREPTQERPSLINMNHILC